MYFLLRILQAIALVVFLWGNANNNAEHLVGAGGPYLVWGSFGVMIIATYLASKEQQKRSRQTEEQTMAGNRRSWIIMAVIVLAAAALTAFQVLL